MPVMYIILPILLFESAFNFEFREFKKVLNPSFLFATVGLNISSLVIAVLLNIILNIDFLAALLFGSVISSTDPIAVLTIFKELGVPKKLQLLVDGESFLNDGTSIIMFKILVKSVTGAALFGTSSYQVLVSGLGDFIVVFFGGAIIGIIFGWLFA